MLVVLRISPQSIPTLFKTACKIWKASMVPTLTFYLLELAVSILFGISDFLTLNDSNAMSLANSGLKFLNFILSMGLFTCIVFRTNNIINHIKFSFAHTVGYGFGSLISVLGVYSTLILASFLAVFY